MVDVLVAEDGRHGLFARGQVQRTVSLLQVNTQVTFCHALGVAGYDVLKDELVVYFLSIHQIFLVLFRVEKCLNHLVSF